MYLHRLFTIQSRNCLSKHFRNYTTKKDMKDVEIDKIRNIGVLAHIDAGKTTTTERMLFYSGLINHMGEVHHGNTVTDFMPQERERGITITSAAISFYWRKHQFNLIDTPGHIDFTMEVEQTLNVLDGVIVVLDGSAGVEAQTLTVWKQADRFNLPRIVFVNKMDRSDASLKSSCKSIEDKLEVPVICLQIPIVDKGKLIGLIDVLTMESVIYDNNSLKCNPLTENNEMYHEVKMARANIIDKLTEFDDGLADLVITSESLDSIKTMDIVKALGKTTCNRQAVPVLMGSAYKNIGVEPLMDSVILYLPSPIKSNEFYTSFADNLCARAFKVRHDKQKGPLVFFRVHNGIFKPNQRIYDIDQKKSEQCGRLYVAYADEFKEVESVKGGNIAVASGLKHVVSGDLVTNSQSSFTKALSQTKRINEETFMSNQTFIPEPVFFCSIEPQSLAFQTALEQALNELNREDPSLRVHYDGDTGQTILSGMGELHLEIIKDRIVKEYKIHVELGELQIAYREAPIEKVTDSTVVETKIGSHKQMVNLKLSLIPNNNPTNKGKLLKFDKTSDTLINPATIFPKHLAAIENGVRVALSNGPKTGSQVINTEIVMHMFEVGRGTSETFITATVSQLIQKMLKDSGTNVLEPVMDMEITTPDEYVSSIMADLSRRRTTIENVDWRGKSKIITATVPLAEVLGYSTMLRTISSGTGNFIMEYQEHRIMCSAEEMIAIKNIRGF